MLAALALLVAQARDVEIGPARTIGTATVRRISLPRPEANPARFLGPSLFFTADGDALLLGDLGGRLRRLSVPDLKVLASARIPAGVSGYGLSRVGLVAFTSVTSQMRVLDPSTLAESQVHAVKNVEAFATGPELDFAFVTQPDFGLASLDLSSGRITREHNLRRINDDFGRRVTRPKDELTFLTAGGFQNAQVSPDGRYLFCMWERQLQRLAISGHDILWEEVALTQPGTLQVSLDSRLVLIPGDRRSPSLALSAVELTKKVALISEEHRVTALNADASGERIFAVGSPDKDRLSVSVFDLRGTRTATVEIEDSGRVSGRLAVHPGGKSVAIPLEDGMIWVEWK